MSELFACTLPPDAAADCPNAFPVFDIKIAAGEFSKEQWLLDCQYAVKIYRSEKTETEDSWSHSLIRLEPDSNDPAYQPLLLEADSSTDLLVIGEFVGIVG